MCAISAQREFLGYMDMVLPWRLLPAAPPDCLFWEEGALPMRDQVGLLIVAPLWRNLVPGLKIGAAG